VNKPGETLANGWLTTEELAKVIKVDPSTLRRWRTAKPLQGPPFYALSDRVTKYSVPDIEQWLAAHRIQPKVAA
jgi:Helix-turn-helix domain